MLRLPVSESPAVRHSIILAIGIALLLLFGAGYSLVSNPLVDYYGTIIRNSTLMEQAKNPLYCQQLASFSLGASFACFDSMQELDAFAASR